MINVYWGLFIILSVAVQYYIIEKLHRYPSKPFWFLVRIAVFSLFMWLYAINGFMWYWSALYMIFAFWMPFNTLLNLARGKYISYLSPKNSPIDKFVLWVFRYEDIAFYVSFILFVIFTGIQIAYGTVPFNEIGR